MGGKRHHTRYLGLITGGHLGHWRGRIISLLCHFSSSIGYMEGIRSLVILGLLEQFYYLFPDGTSHLLIPVPRRARHILILYPRRAYDLHILCPRRAYNLLKLGPYNLDLLTPSHPWPP